MAGGEPRRAWLRWLIAAAVVLSAFLLPIGFEENRIFAERAMDCAHVPFFALLTLWLWRNLPGEPRMGWSARLGAVALCGALLAAGLEIAQRLVNREPGIDDALRSGAGVFLAVAGIVVWEEKPRWLLRILLTAYAAAMCAYIALPAWREFRGIAWRRANFPVLADFESSGGLRLWAGFNLGDLPWGAKFARVRGNATEGAHSLRVRMVAGGTPSIRLLCGGADWRGRGALAFDVFNPGPPFELSVRIDDDFAKPAHGDRFNRALPIAPGWNRIRIPLGEIEHGPKNRALNIARIRRLVLFRNQPVTASEFFLDYVRLE